MIMVKLKNNLDRSPIEDEKEPVKCFSKAEALYVALICFSTYCLSCIAFEAGGGRSPTGNTLTKSATFNALFGRTYNLKITIHANNVITGLISTVMMILGDKYGIPYLYLPWLANTMKGMALYEGPTLVNLVKMLLPNVTLPARTLILAAFLLYGTNIAYIFAFYQLTITFAKQQTKELSSATEHLEQLFIWNDAFIEFRRCWNGYRYQNQSTVEKVPEKLFILRRKKILHQENANYKPNIAPKTDRSKSPNCPLTSVKSSIGNNNDLLRNQLLNISGL